MCFVAWTMLTFCLGSGVITEALVFVLIPYGHRLALPDADVLSNCPCGRRASRPGGRATSAGVRASFAFSQQ